MRKSTLVLFILLAFSSTSSLLAQPFEFGTGDNTTKEDFDKILKSATRATRDLTDLPPSYSLKKFAPPVMSQGKYGTCVAWSSAYAARSISYAVQRNFTNKDSILKYTFSPGYLYSKIKIATDNDCSMGSNFNSALSVMKTNGVLLKSENIADCVPYNSITRPGDFRIKEFLSLSSYTNITKNDLLKIKKSLSENKPVLLSMKTYRSFYSTPGGVWTPVNNDQALGYHAMCIVGYDDQRAGGSFEVMNSWGDKWGDKGFFYPTYDQILTYGNWVVELMDNEVPKTIKKDEKVDLPKLSGKFEFIKLDGSVMPVTRSKISTRSITVEDDDQAAYSQYKLAENYPGGTAFKIKFTTNAPAFVYIFSQDDKQVLSRLFPYNPTVSPAINSSNATIFLPSETKHARLSNNPGEENICVLYSKDELNFEGLLTYIKDNGVSIEQAVKDKFGKSLVPINNIKFSDTSINFQAPADDNNLVCFFIDLQHK